MLGLLQKFVLLFLMFFIVLFFQVESRAQKIRVLSVDIHSGLTFQQEDSRELFDLYFDFNGSFAARKPNWTRGVRVRGDVSTKSNQIDVGIIAGYRTYDRVFTQRLQPNNFAVIYSNTNVLMRHHILTGGISLSHWIKGLGNSTLGIHTNIELLMPFLDVTRVDSEVRRYLDDSPKQYRYSERVNNFQNGFADYFSLPGINLGLELSYTFFKGKWGLKPFICGEYMNFNNRNLFVSRLGLGFVMR